MMQLTFIEFLTEDSDAAEMAGWFNVAKNLEYVDPDDVHQYLLGKHWQEIGITHAEIRKNIEEENASRQRSGGYWAKQTPLNPDDPEDQANYAMEDGKYERFYREGWVRWYRHDRFGMMEFTSILETLRRSKKKILELVKEYHPGQILLSDEYSDEGATFHKVISGDELRYGKWDI
jgi:hypothetical protein